MGSNPGDHQPLTLQEVISGLRPLVVWMSNSLELLQFIQFQLPLVLEWRLGKEQRERDNTEVENLGNDLKGFYMIFSQSHKVIAVRMYTVDQLMCDLCGLYIGFPALLELHLSRVRSASEETVAALEEVIMLTFQQCVYYITKVRIHSTTAVLPLRAIAEVKKHIISYFFANNDCIVMQNMTGI